ncbi:unnamed protein product [Pleuronectes platessa]|uniref:Uncharacterized protein n=1 Tax=Pleuronectes platessa TaxID=8262 RepID=A0A9N7Z311_PLEPL|nr:unnamed protein product [Pleuronectes platessa]
MASSLPGGHPGPSLLGSAELGQPQPVHLAEHEACPYSQWDGVCLSHAFSFSARLNCIRSCRSRSRHGCKRSCEGERRGVTPRHCSRCEERNPCAARPIPVRSKKTATFSHRFPSSARQLKTIPECLWPSAGQKFNKFQMCFACVHTYGGRAFNTVTQPCIRAPFGTGWKVSPPSLLFSSLTPAVPSHDPLQSRHGPIVSVHYVICTVETESIEEKICYCSREFPACCQGLSACVPCPPSSLACLSSPPRLSFLLRLSDPSHIRWLPGLRQMLLPKAC